jgi:site-specific DNA-methyltransferase (adenine-specific)
VQEVCLENEQMKPYYQDDAVSIYHGDCREILPGLEPVDLVLTDPPYGIGEDGGLKARYRNGDGRAKGIVKHQQLNWDKRRIEPELVSLITKMAPVWFIFGGNYYADLLPASPGWLYWDKRIGGDFSDGELIYTNRNAGLRSFSCHPFKDLIGGQLREHPTEKPLDVIKWCLSFTPDAQTILDPFMGSGTTLRAAKDLGRKAIGIEIEEKYCEIAAKRMSQEVLKFEFANGRAQELLF